MLSHSQLLRVSDIGLDHLCRPSDRDITHAGKFWDSGYRYHGNDYHHHYELNGGKPALSFNLHLKNSLLKTQMRLLRFARNDRMTVIARSDSDEAISTRLTNYTTGLLRYRSQ